jgi:carboxyl-terminal processing protease
MTPEAATYLEEAITYIQRHALRSTAMDWNSIRSEALARIQDAESSADTYLTLRWVLSCLGDHHSHLTSPQSVQQRQEGIVTSMGFLAVYPEGVIVDIHANSPAEHAGLAVGDIIETINGDPRAHLDRSSCMRALRTSPVTLTFRRANQELAPSVTLQTTSYTQEMKLQGWPLRTDIGYLELPAVTGSDVILRAYAQTAQQRIRDMDQAGIRHWVIDVRRNMGGDMWAMLAGVRSLLGEDECGFFLSPEGKRISWLPSLAKRTKALIGEPYCLAHLSGATAVLTSRLTCSSGEFTTLAFRGRLYTRSFGEPTAGLPTANQSKTLRDGAQLFLTVALGADRTGRVYEGPIIPDQLVTCDWTHFQTECDSVLLSAIEWLS